MSHTLSLDLRPKDFAEVIGHDNVVASIRATLAAGRVPVGWLFAGPPGFGKTTLAKILALAVQRPETLSLAQRDALDIREYNSADINGVDEIRELVRSSEYAPLAGRYRVNILNEVQRLTDPAQNVLLVPLEKQNGPTVWILTTTAPEKLIKPLRDRCVAFTLRPLSEQGIKTLVARAEKALSKPSDPAFVAGVLKSGLASPREILMAYEKFAAGMPLAEALACPENEPQYVDIAKAVVRGDWSRTREMLGQVKTADSRGLRSVAAAFLKGDLLKSSGARADGLSAALRGLAMYNTFEDGIAFATTVAVLYEACKKLAGTQEEF